MKYSRNQINNAGDILLSAKDEKEYTHATDIINDWRTLHLPALDELHNSMVSILRKEHIQIHSVSQRLKRLSSIQNKLDRNPEMKLGGLQDIGGLRIVFPTMDILNKTYDILVENMPDNFELTKDPVNYVLKPKDSGYRSIHIVITAVSLVINWHFAEWTAKDIITIVAMVLFGVPILVFGLIYCYILGKKELKNGKI